MDASLPRRAPRRNRKPIKLLIGAMSRIVCELRERIAAPPHDRLSADDFAQMVICGLVTVLAQREQFAPAADWLLASAPEWQQDALRESLAAVSGGPHPKCRWLMAEEVERLSAAVAQVAWESADASDVQGEHLYEQFLAVHASGERRRKGVFFTPRPIVRFMLGQVDRQLREELGRSEGIAAADVTLLDPAAGTGVFLTEAVTLIHQRFCERGRSAAEWNEYVVEQLLPRVTGIELMPTSCLLAHLHLATRLGQSGFNFHAPSPIEVSLGNALSGPDTFGQGKSASLVVVLGNPPFSYLSENDSPWIKGLIRGEGGARGYLDFDGERLGERKTWLHDDYVKFLRYAQWRVETAGSGIVAFVTNHGYLDNTTFRLMRRQLTRTFPRIAVIDLHGSRKKEEVAPDGGRDENVFGLDQGVAIGFFRTAGQEATVSAVEHSEAWGSKDLKLAAIEEWIDDGPAYQPISPAAPDFRWSPLRGESPAEYGRGVRLPDEMPVYTTAPVTARDGLVVAFSQEELLNRMERFCDVSISDEQIRSELFPRSRTARYPAGDTRSWKLSEARRRLAEETDLARYVQRCLYRPFDWRFVFWHEAMIDWPRSEVMRHLLDGSDADDCGGVGNLALIARRQMLPSQPCTYFWVTDCLTLDGVIRSDNRGSEAVFPQWLLDSDGVRRLNLGRQVEHAGRSMFVNYAYALFHAPGYRERYADDLRRDFPRVMLPKESSLLERLSGFGEKLINLHLLRPSAAERQESPPAGDEHAVAVETAYPRFEGRSVYAQQARIIATCSEEAWRYRVGGHQVLRKWLADRRGRLLGAAEVRRYLRIVAAIEQTLELLPAIESAVEEHGGWSHVFAP